MYKLTLAELRAFAIMIKSHSPEFNSTDKNIMKDKGISKDYINSMLYECIGVKKRK